MRNNMRLTSKLFLAFAITISIVVIGIAIYLKTIPKNEPFIHSELNKKELTTRESVKEDTENKIKHYSMIDIGEIVFSNLENPIERKIDTAVFKIYPPNIEKNKNAKLEVYNKNEKIYTSETYNYSNLIAFEYRDYKYIIINEYSGGAHCCSTAPIFVLDKDKDLKLIETLDLENTSISEKSLIEKNEKLYLAASDDRFAYFHVPYAGSYFFMQYYLIENGVLTKNNFDFKEDYIIEAEKCRKEADNYFENIKRKENISGFESWSPYLVCASVNYILSGQEEKAWQEFDELFKKAISTSPMLAKDISSEEIKEEIKGKMKEFISDKKSAIKTGRAELDDRIDIEKLQLEIDSGDQTWKKLYEGSCHGDCGQTEFRKMIRLNPDLVLLNLKNYGFNDDDIKNAKEVLNEKGKKVYNIRHELDSYFVTLHQPTIGLFKVWIISEIELEGKICQPKLIGIKLKNEGVNRIFEETDNKLYPIISPEQFTEKGYKMYCVKWYYLDELPDEILNKLPESNFTKNLESVNTGNWSLYQDEERKLSFSHPKEWNVAKKIWGEKWNKPFYDSGSFSVGPMGVKTSRTGMWGLDYIGTITINGQKTFMLKSLLGDYDSRDNSSRVSYYTKLDILGEDFYIEYKPEYNSIDNNKENESIFYNVLLTFKSFKSLAKNETADWKEFKSEKDGFEIKYPDNLNQNTQTIIGEDYIYTWTRIGSSNPFILITSKSSEGLSLEEWLKKNKIKTDYGKENIILDNATFLKYYDADKGFYNFYTIEKDKVYIITLTERDDIIKKILSTLKFVEE